MAKAPCLDCPSFDPFSFQQDGLTPPEVDIGRGQVVQALVLAVVVGDGKRQRTRVFSELRFQYLFEDRFGRPDKGNDKGKVEGLVGYCRRNFLVPKPRFHEVPVT